MEALTVESFEKSLFAFGLCIPRLFAVFIVLPFTSQAVLSTTARAGITISLALIVFPLVLDSFPVGGIKPSDVFVLVVKELFVGLAIGYLVAVLFWGIEAVGYFIDTHRGATLSGALHLTFGEESSPLASFLMQTFTVLFFIGGGVFVFLEGLYQSYVAWPILSFFPNTQIGAMDFFIAQFALIAYLAIFIGGPVIIAMFIAEISLALVSRFVPQLQVFFLSLPVKSGIAILMMILYMTTLVAYLKTQMTQFGILFGDLDVLFK